MAIATEVVAEQRSEEWHKARAGRATASKFNAIVFGGVGKDTYVSEVLLERLSGKVKESFQSKAMLDGVETESLARLRYETTTGNVVTECGFFAHNKIMCGASPDGLVNHDGLVEIKCPIEKTHLATLHTSKIPNQYYWQMVGQMWMTERKWCDYVSFHPDFPPNAQLFIKRVERDENDITKLAKAVVSFLKDVDYEKQFVTNYKGKGGLVTVTRITHNGR